MFDVIDLVKVGLIGLAFGFGISSLIVDVMTRRALRRIDRHDQRRKRNRD